MLWLFSRQLPSPIGLPFRSCHSVVLLLRYAVWMAGFEPAFSGSRSRRIQPGSPTSRFSRCRLPLPFTQHSALSTQQWDPRDSNPHRVVKERGGCRRADPLKDDRLVPISFLSLRIFRSSSFILHPFEVRTGGTRTLTLPLKGWIRCHYATAPMGRSASVFVGSCSVPPKKKGQVSR